MSAVIKTATPFIDVECLCEALTKVGCGYEVKGNKVITNRKDLRLGFQEFQKDEFGRYALYAYSYSDKNQANFIRKVEKEYNVSYQIKLEEIERLCLEEEKRRLEKERQEFVKKQRTTILDRAKAQGYSVKEKQVNGKIKLILTVIHTKVNIAHIEEQSFIYGPGCRFVIWVQGCSIHCKGCWNKEMWSFKPKRELSTTDLFELIQLQGDSIEGITLLGGEPLDQFEEVSELFQLCKTVGISTMLFTGYEPEEIREKQMVEILNYTDILITGRYQERLRTINRQWIGSTNQEIQFLSDRYRNYELKDSNYVEISIDDFGKVEVFGFPTKTLLDKTILSD